MVYDQDKEEGPSSILYYAARYWPAHFVNARSGWTNSLLNREIVQNVKKLLESESRLTTWLEFSFDFNREAGDPDEVLAAIVAMSESLCSPPNPEESSGHCSQIFADA